MNNNEMTAELVKYQPIGEKDVDEKVIKKKGILASNFKRILNLRKYYDDFVVLMSMIIDWRKGKYNDVSKQTIMLLCAALIYVLSPFDFITDLLPFVGYLDDAAIIGFILNKCSNETDRYKKWKNFNVDLEVEG